MSTAMFTVETLLYFVAKLRGLVSNHCVFISSNLAWWRLFGVFALLTMLCSPCSRIIWRTKRQSG
jgi:hypothetical protein